MLPFPDDYYTKADPRAATGRRIDFRPNGDARKRARPAHRSRARTTSATASARARRSLLKIPGIETAADVSAIGGRADQPIGRYKKANAPVVVIDANTGERWPIWVEIDSTVKDRAKAHVEIHPAVNFKSGHRYIVALRNLKNAAEQSSKRLRRSAPTATTCPPAKKRSTPGAAHFEELFSTLKKAGHPPPEPLPRVGLHRRERRKQHWPRALDPRPRVRGARRQQPADGIVEGTSPTFVVTKAENEPQPAKSRGASRAPSRCPASCSRAARRAARCCSTPNGTRSKTGSGRPTSTASSRPRPPTGAGESARPSLYGHGLFGNASEVGSGPQRSLSQKPRHRPVRDRRDRHVRSGRPDSDHGPQNLSLVPAAHRPPAAGPARRALPRPGDDQPDRVRHQRRLPPGRHAGDPSVLDTSHLYYNGNSQGGIMGGALTAVSPDFTRASLGVPAMNYSVLLPRSVDFDEFADFLYPSYPDEEARPLIFDLMQLLWDRGEPNGYARADDDQPAAGHAATPGAARRRLRRPPGDRLPGRRRGPHDRRLGAPPVLYNGPLAGHRPLWNVPAIEPLSVHRLGDLLLGRRADPRNLAGLGQIRRHRTAAVREPAQPHRAKTRTACRGRRRPSSSSSRTSSTGRSRPATSCDGGPCYAGSFTGP